MLARSGWRSIISLALYASQVRGVHGNISILLILIGTSFEKNNIVRFCVFILSSGRVKGFL